MQVIIPASSLVSMLTLETAAAGLFDGAKVGLATNTDVLTDQTVYADLVQPTYGGYAISSAVVWGTVRRARNGTVQVQAASKVFAPTDSTASDTITYVTLLNGAGNAILALLKLDTPVLLAAPSDELTVTFPLLLAQTLIEPLDTLP